MKIPKHIIDEHKKGVENLRFYGHAVTDLDRDELLAALNSCARTMKDDQKRFTAFVDLSRDLAKAAERKRL